MSFHGFGDQLVQRKLSTARYLVIPKKFCVIRHGCPADFSNPVPLLGEIVVFGTRAMPRIPRRRG